MSSSIWKRRRANSVWRNCRARTRHWPRSCAAGWTRTRVATRASAAGSGAKADDRVGAYRLVRQLGSGGMGQVWLAERADGQFAQQVALKLIHPDLASPEAGPRFRRERQILADLRHPHIAQLID